LGSPPAITAKVGGYIAPETTARGYQAGHSRRLEQNRRAYPSGRSGLATFKHSGHSPALRFAHFDRWILKESPYRPPPRWSRRSRWCQFHQPRHGPKSGPQVRPILLTLEVEGFGLSQSEKLAIAEGDLVGEVPEKASFRSHPTSPYLRERIAQLPRLGGDPDTLNGHHFWGSLLPAGGKAEASAGRRVGPAHRKKAGHPHAT
jgi:hypothetical protein